MIRIGLEIANLGATIVVVDIQKDFIHTPGHSDDSISLWLDEGSLFVGDLNPLYELEAYKGTQIAETWEKLLKLNPKRIYYGHAKKLEKNKTEE